MTNEKDTTEWWIDWMNQRGLSMRNVEGIAKHADMYELVAEAERRGEMKAWEEVSLVLKDVKQEFRCAACDGASNLSHTHTCSAFAKIEAKLTSLKTP